MFVHSVLKFDAEKNIMFKRLKQLLVDIVVEGVKRALAEVEEEKQKKAFDEAFLDNLLKRIRESHPDDEQRQPLPTSE